MSDRDDIVQYLRELRGDMIKAERNAYLECIATCIIAMVIAAAIVAFVTWLKVG